MSLQWELNRELPVDTAALGQAILSEKNAYRQIGDRFNELFPPEEEFAPLYSTMGRGAIAPLLMALVTVFQMLEKAPDRLAAESVVSRIDWKYALHLPLTYTGFHFTDLGAFRERLLAHQQERIVFDALLLRLKTLGLIKQRGKMRTDSTHVLGVVERLSQLELIAESLRVALQAVTEVATEWVSQAIPAAFRDVYDLRQSEYGLSEAEIRGKLVQVGQDGFWFLAQLDAAPEMVRRLREIEVLRAVMGQQFPQGPGQPPATKRPTGSDVIESPHEPEVRYGTKRGKSWVGYKMQLTETCDEDLPHLIVDIEPTSALANDSPELPRIQARLEEQDILPGEQQVDQGYMSGKNLVESTKKGIELMGIPLADTQAPAGFHQTDFQIDEAQRQARCPAGYANTVWAERTPHDDGPPAIHVRFDAATCQRCPHFGRCTTSKQGRSLTLHPYRAALEARRAEARTEAFRDKLHPRAGIESTISELVRRHQARSARYRGKAKLRLQGYFTAVAANLKRLMRWLAQTQPFTTAIATS